MENVACICCPIITTKSSANVYFEELLMSNIKKIEKISYAFCLTFQSNETFVLIECYKNYITTYIRPIESSSIK